MINFITLVPGVDPGYLPEFFSRDDPRPAREQINSAYTHGGGWRPQQGFTLNTKDMTMSYPGDPVFKPLAISSLGDEILIFYEHEYLAIIQPDASFESPASTSDDSYLTTARLHHVYGACWRAEGTRNSLQRIEVTGWLLRHTFKIKQLHAYREEIIRMLLSLPAGFRADVGEGGSVGNMIERGDGVVWSMDMSDIEKLVALGLASGLMNFCAPREKWHLLPGGLPYVRVEITMFGVSVN